MKRANFQRFFGLCLGLLLLAIPVIGLSSLSSLLPAKVGVVKAAPFYQASREVFFTQVAFNVDEDAVTANINVRVSPAITDTTIVTVDYFTADGTATEGDDYIAASGTLTFTQSAQTRTFTVSILDDNDDEPSETVNLNLTNPTNAVADPPSAILRINDDDPTPTNTPTATSGAPPVFADVYEPNNTLQDAYPTSADAPKLCDITLWPVGDQDFFQFQGKRGSAYEISTSDLDAGLDTVIKVFDPRGEEIASNDDFEIGSRRSQVTITAERDGLYYVRVRNQDPTDPADKTYCVEINEITPPTATPTVTRIAAADECEENGSLEKACTIAIDTTYSMNFVPVSGTGPDNDYYRLWVKSWVTYECETLNLSPYADTNMIFYDQNGNDFIPNLGNDDKVLEGTDYGSKLTIMSKYTGWLNILIGPVNPPPYEESFLHTYDLQCIAIAATATPTPTNTLPPAPPVVVQPTATEAPPTPSPAATFDFSFLTPSPTPTPPQLQFQPLPTETPFGGVAQVSTINVTIYYDINNSNTPELTEGIMDVDIYLYNNATGELLATGRTNEAGMQTFNVSTPSGNVRVVVPLLNYSQDVLGSENLLIRVEPQPLPIGIP